MINFEELREKTILVTGSTGLIGSNVIEKLVEIGAKVIAVARNEMKSKRMSFYSKVKWYYFDMVDEYQIDEEIDYIIHSASPTDSKYFITNPVDTINSAIIGLNNILTFALKKKIKTILFTSSLEVYGICTDDIFVNENQYFGIDCTNVRNSYSEGKKILECLCFSYGLQFNLPVKVVRLCQTFGRGVTKNDNRVFAQFARSVINHEDIVLSTKGETKRTYCSVDDAVNGILTVLLYGENNEAYNIASDDTFYSIFEMANKFAYGNGIKVIIKEEQDNKYLPTIKFGLDTTKIKKIGFVSKDNLDSIILKFLSYYRSLFRC